MSVLYVLLPLALGLAATAVLAFVWAVRRGQLDDLDTPAMRILADDDSPLPKARPGAARPRRRDTDGDAKER